MSERLDLDFLADHPEGVAGPVLRDEAAFLYFLARLLRPAVAVELGTGEGHSALALLEGGCGLVVSADLAHCGEARQRLARFGNRFRHVWKRHEHLEPTDLLVSRIDLLFLDGGHVHVVALQVLPRLLPLLAPSGVIVQHDTGPHPDGGHVHQPGEVQTARWLEDLGLRAVHLHGAGTLGLSLYQRPGRSTP